MLVLLLLFSMVAIAVIQTGITRARDEEDPEWRGKGGDASMATISPLPVDETSLDLNHKVYGRENGGPREGYKADGSRQPGK